MRSVFEVDRHRGRVERLSYARRPSADFCFNAEAKHATVSPLALLGRESGCDRCDTAAESGVRTIVFEFDQSRRQTAQDINFGRWRDISANARREVDGQVISKPQRIHAGNARRDKWNDSRNALNGCAVAAEIKVEIDADEAIWADAGCAGWQQQIFHIPIVANADLADYST